MAWAHRPWTLTAQPLCGPLPQVVVPRCGDGRTAPPSPLTGELTAMPSPPWCRSAWALGARLASGQWAVGSLQERRRRQEWKRYFDPSFPLRACWNDGARYAPSTLPRCGCRRLLMLGTAGGGVVWVANFAREAANVYRRQWWRAGRSESPPNPEPTGDRCTSFRIVDW